jgi:hypothetical protein
VVVLYTTPDKVKGLLTDADGGAMEEAVVGGIGALF